MKGIASRLGFDACGIAAARSLDADARRLEDWLQRGMHGKMQYMENYFDLRIDPRKLVPEAKSVISLLVNYYPGQQQDPSLPQVSKYAYGNDYHDVIRKKLNIFFDELKAEVGDIAGRGFVDSAPVLERSWAQASGLGWVAKNGNLINKEKGSFYFLACLITDLDLVPDQPYMQDYCGTCTKCIDACPTEAILPGKVVDGSKCISYFTIELKDLLIPENYASQFGNRLFGCDVCQDVCPWNRFSSPHSEPAFEPVKEILQFTQADWEDLTEERFKQIFRDSPIKRTKYAGIRRNLSAIKNNAPGPT